MYLAEMKDFGDMEAVKECLAPFILDGSSPFCFTVGAPYFPMRDKLAQVQAKFERLASTTSFAAQMRRTARTKAPGALVHIDPGLLIADVPRGYVPVAVGSTPRGQSAPAPPMYSVTW